MSMRGFEVKPGRELDSIVAEKVMGWKWNAESAWLGDSKWSRTHGDPWSFLPHYSTDIADAWAVVEKLREGNDVELKTLYWGKKTDWWVRLNSGFDVNTFAETAPMAICKAAILAVGVEI
jgi:hypothetical protein